MMIYLGIGLIVLSIFILGGALVFVFKELNQHGELLVGISRAISSNHSDVQMLHKRLTKTEREIKRLLKSKRRS